MSQPSKMTIDQLYQKLAYYDQLDEFTLDDQVEFEQVCREIDNRTMKETMYWLE